MALNRDNRVSNADPSNADPSNGYAGRGQGKPTLRTEAEALGIDTHGLSHNQVKQAVADTKKADSDMQSFITKVADAINNKPKTVQQPSSEVTSRKTSDTPSALKGAPSAASKKGESGGTPVEFYCYSGGVLSKVKILCESAPVAS